MKSNKFVPLIALMGLLVAGCDGTSEVSEPGESTSEGEVSQTAEPIPEDDNVHLVLLAGASGARGKALNSDIDASEYTFDDVKILADGYRMESLGGISDSPTSNLRYLSVTTGFGDVDSEFGPELGIAKELSARYGLNELDDPRSTIVKYAGSGSTFYDHWMSETSVADTSLDLNRDDVRTNEKLGLEVGPMTNNFYQMTDNAITHYENLGYDVTIDGVIFLHGEQDAKYTANMAVYEEVLTNFVNDIRSYVGDEDLPFVITEALTNSARYSNELREIQERVASATDSIFVETQDLYLNSFEPWHFDANSNIEVGRRAVSELIALRDNRQISSIDTGTIDVPSNTEVELPNYLEVTYTDGSSGLVPVSSYGTYDNTTLGTQSLDVTIEYNTYVYNGQITINVTNSPYVDGVINEPSYSNAVSVGNKTSVQLYSSDEGLYIGATVTDSNINTDGENWHVYDMGQMTENDDLEIYLADTSSTSGDASMRYSIFLSSANLLRVYGQGFDTSTLSTSMPDNNLLYQKSVSGFEYRVLTVGEMNDGTSTSMTMELFIPYEELGITSTDNLKVLLEYNDVTLSGSTKSSSSSFYPSTLTGSSSAYEAELSNYVSLSSLL